MNILFIAAKEDYKNLSEVTKKFSKENINFYLPLGIYDNQRCRERIINVPFREHNNKRYLSINDIKQALEQEKIDHTRLILSFKGKDKVDAAIFFNTRGKLEECETKEILYTLKQNIPLYLSKDDERIKDIASIYNIDPKLIRFNTEKQKDISDTKKKTLK